MVEGANVLHEALASDVPVESLYVDCSHVVPGDRSDLAIREAHRRGARVYDLAPGVIERVAATVTPQPVLAVVPCRDVPLSSLRNADLLLICVDLRDPGNAGTVLRSAQAAGASGVLCCDGSVDVFNPKTVRASAGALFRVPVVAGGDAVEVLEEVGRWGLCRLATAARGGTDYATVDLARPVALVLGNEAHGLPADLAPVLDGVVTIPMAGDADSLNVGMAAAVLCFEAARQRRAAGTPATGIGAPVRVGQP